MKVKRVFFIVAFTIFLSPKFLFSQDRFENEYDIREPFLYNGLLYSPVNSSKFLTNQFFETEQFALGKANIREVDYHNLYLNYDIYNQEILLKYPITSSSNRIIMLSKSWLASFQIGDKKFILLDQEQGKRTIYQLICDGDIKLVYYWYKKLIYVNDYIGNTSISFEKIRKQYLYTNGKLLPFKNNKEFVKNFELSKQESIRRYLKENKIKVGNATDSVMENLINYCNNIKK